MSKLKGIVLFLSGTAIGYAAGYFLTKRHYENLYRTEIELTKAELREHYLGKTEPKDTEKTPDEEKTSGTAKTENNPLLKYAADLAKRERYNYGDPSAVGTDDVEEDEPYVAPGEDYKPIGDINAPAPYIIHPDVYGQEDDYTTAELLCFADDVIVDDTDLPIENRNMHIPRDLINHFGEFDADTVYVRNEQLKIDYEILRSERSYYGDYIEDKPYLKEQLGLA